MMSPQICSTQYPRPLRALYIEDSPRDAKLYSYHLKQAGFDLAADVVASLEEFVNAIHSASYDVILADYRLPNWSGMDALEVLHREGTDIPFILVSGSVGDEIAAELIKKGAADYVLKDRLARLSHAVTRALDERAAREEQRRAEHGRELLASIVESSDDAIIGIALDGTILSWNRGAMQIYGYTASEIQERPIDLLFAPDRHEELRKALETLESGESVGRYESTGKKKSGGAIDVAVTLSPIRQPETGPRGASAIIRDITEQKRLQQEFFMAQKMEAIGRLAAGVAHDFNNLLTVITGYSSFMLSQLKEYDPLYNEVREVNKAGERAASLTRQLLAFSRKQVMQPRVLDLNKIVAEMDRMLRRLIGEDVDLVTELDPALGSVKADPGQLEQVIMNIAVNSRDAMPKGGKLTIETTNVDMQEPISRQHVKVPPGSYVVLAITDTGAGMDAETQARIFEPFFTTKGPGQGTGLGLSTVFGIVEQSGGAIFVYSEPGHGTTFKIYLPRAEEIKEAVEVAPVVTSVRGSETVLVVEDEDSVRGLVCQLLQKHGYTVLQAKNGGEALLMCEQTGHIDLMITDLIMPSMSGSDLASRLKPLRPEMKVLFISGYSEGAIAHQGWVAPDTAFLEKPFAPRALAQKVRELLD